jgi:uncharacterized protein
MFMSHVASDYLTQSLTRFIEDKAFPCVGAKSALARQNLRFVVAQDIRAHKDDRRLWQALVEFAGVYRQSQEGFHSLAVIFSQPDDLCERAFEACLWQRLQALSDLDAQHFAYDPCVSCDAQSPDFSLSFGGEAFFVVGMHPNASRPARRFEAPCLVFNRHAQFESLREEGRYETLRSSILDRDFALAGSLNPMLARHGELSEARQYSGRVVEAEWRCPFSAAETKV